jgi:hypothetical protein
MGVLALVTFATTAWAQTVPTITAISSPRQVVMLGQNLTLSVTATGTPAPTYQWKRNGLPIIGATGDERGGVRQCRVCHFAGGGVGRQQLWTNHGASRVGQCREHRHERLAHCGVEG